MFWLGKIIPTGMPAYFRGTGPDSLSNVMLTGINIPIRIGNATVMPGDVVLGDEEGLFFIPPHLVKDAIDAAQSTKARDEWIKSKMDLRKYKSSELYGRPGSRAAEGDGRVHQDAPVFEIGSRPVATHFVPVHLPLAAPARSTSPDIFVALWILPV